MKGHIFIVTIVLLAMAGALSLAGQNTQTQQNQKINGYLIDINYGSIPREMNWLPRSFPRMAKMPAGKFK